MTEIYKCKRCGFKTTNKSVAQSHARTHHAYSSSSDDSYTPIGTFDSYISTCDSSDSYSSSTSSDYSSGGGDFGGGGSSGDW